MPRRFCFFTARRDHQTSQRGLSADPSGGHRSLVAFPILLALVMREVGWRALFGNDLGALMLRALIMFVSYTAY